MPVISSSLCVCVCWYSPLCSCDPWDSGWAVTLLISPSRNTAWKMSSEHSELCLHSLQVPSLLIWQVIITQAPLPLPSRGLRHKNKEEEGDWRRQNKGIKLHSQTRNCVFNNQVIQTPKLEKGGLLLFSLIQRDYSVSDVSVNFTSFRKSFPKACLHL